MTDASEPFVMWFSYGTHVFNSPLDCTGEALFALVRQAAKREPCREWYPGTLCVNDPMMVERVGGAFKRHGITLRAGRFPTAHYASVCETMYRQPLFQLIPRDMLLDRMSLEDELLALGGRTWAPGEVCIQLERPSSQIRFGWKGEHRVVTFRWASQELTIQFRSTAVGKYPAVLPEPQLHHPLSPTEALGLLEILEQSRKRQSKEAVRNLRPDTTLQLAVALKGHDVSRTLEILPSATLEDLHDAIQHAFGWDNDHLYEFTLKRGAELRYADPRCSDGGETADDVKIGQLGLGPKDRLEYLFDFGACWRHDIRYVGAGMPRKGEKYPLVVSSKGRNVPQYRHDD